MKARRSYAILRLLVLVGCIPLLQLHTTVPLVRAQSGYTCGFFQVNANAQCPSSCTTGTYTGYSYQSLGFAVGYIYPNPCSGDSCVQPETYTGDEGVVTPPELYYLLLWIWIQLRHSVYTMRGSKSVLLANVLRHRRHLLRGRRWNLQPE